MWILLTLAVVVGVATGVGTRALIPVLRRHAPDVPNERSLHAAPTPRGGGVVAVGAVLAVLLWLIVAGRVAPGALAVVVGGVVLAAVSWFDDRAGISAGARLAVQILVVALSLLAQPLGGAVFQYWLPPLADRIATMLVWVWFLNLFNFMDGADGLPAARPRRSAQASRWWRGWAGYDPALALLPCAAAAVGFLASNWAPARVFMGDAGSVPLGYLIGSCCCGWRRAGCGRRR